MNESTPGAARPAHTRQPRDGGKPGDGRTTTLAQAFAALRDDLDAQQAPPALLAAAKRAAHRGLRPQLTGPSVTTAAEASAGAMLWRWLRLPAPADSKLWAAAAASAVVLCISLLLALQPAQLQPPRDVVAGGAAAGHAGDAGGWASRASGREPSETRVEAAADSAPAMHFVPLVGPERLRALATPPARSAGGDTRPLQGVVTAAWVLTAELPQQRLAAMGLPYDPGHAAEPLRAELLVAASGEVLAVRLVP